MLVAVVFFSFSEGRKLGAALDWNTMVIGPACVGLTYVVTVCEAGDDLGTTRKYFFGKIKSSPYIVNVPTTIYPAASRPSPYNFNGESRKHQNLSQPFALQHQFTMHSGLGSCPGRKVNRVSSCHHLLASNP